VFDGFLPAKPGKRLNRLRALRERHDGRALRVAHRIVATLGASARSFGEVELVLARELTKQYEES